MMSFKKKYLWDEAQRFGAATSYRRLFPEKGGWKPFHLDESQKWYYRGSAATQRDQGTVGKEDSQATGCRMNKQPDDILPEGIRDCVREMQERYPANGFPDREQPSPQQERDLDLQRDCPPRHPDLSLDAVSIEEAFERNPFGDVCEWVLLVR